MRFEVEYTKGGIKLVDDKAFLDFCQKNEGKFGEIDPSIYGKAKTKSSKAHRYFFGVVIPCVVHAYFEAGHISESQFKSFSKEDCKKYVADKYFVKERCPDGFIINLSMKISHWKAYDWMLKVQSIIDDVQDKFDYAIPEADLFHEKNFLERLQGKIK